jgi:hypothetical protein
MELSIGMEPTPMEPTDILRYPEWQKTYQEALIEVDEIKLTERLSAAQAAISKRLQDLSGDPDHHAERHAIHDALAFIRVLQRHSASPDTP